MITNGSLVLVLTERQAYYLALFFANSHTMKFPDELYKDSEGEATVAFQEDFHEAMTVIEAQLRKTIQCNRSMREI